MQFENSFSVDAPLSRVWEFLLNVQEVAPCVPGAELTEVISDREYKGMVKIKLGAVQMTYRGTVVLKEVDEQSHRVVLSASGSESRGTGSASGTVTSTLVEEGPNRTTVTLLSEINVTGRVAQFGRNIMQEVANRLIREFAQCLERKLMAGPTPVGEEVSGVATQPPSTGQIGSTAGAPPPAEVSATPEVTDAHTSPPAGPATVDQPGPAKDYRPVATTHPAPAEPVKMLPLVADIARSQLAAGLRKLAKLIEPRS
jgi:carbon monoxide dehydrogenase subunit G